MSDFESLKLRMSWGRGNALLHSADSPKMNYIIGLENLTVFFSKATLIICPASLLDQWAGEVKKRVKGGHMTVHVYHGNSRHGAFEQTGGF